MLPLACPRDRPDAAQRPLGDGDPRALVRPGARHRPRPASSWSDWRAIELEIEAISRWLGPGTDVLDAGCATGYSTARFAARHRPAVPAIDYVPEMVEHALERQAGCRARSAPGSTSASATSAPLSSTTRASTARDLDPVVINLGEHRGTAAARSASLPACTPARGLLLLSEATTQGLGG